MNTKIIDIKPAVNSIILFESRPTRIKNDLGEEIEIYGILYNRIIKHDDDLFIYEVNRYVSYLRGCEKIQSKGAELYPTAWVLPNANKVSLKLTTKELIYKLMRNKRLGYRIVEREAPLELREDEVDGCFLISTKPLERMGINYGVRKDNQKNQKDKEQKPLNKRELEKGRKEVNNED